MHSFWIFFKDFSKLHRKWSSKGNLFKPDIYLKCAREISATERGNSRGTATQKVWFSPSLYLLHFQITFTRCVWSSWTLVGLALILVIPLPAQFYWGRCELGRICWAAGQPNPGTWPPDVDAPCIFGGAEMPRQTPTSSTPLDIQAECRHFYSSARLMRHIWLLKEQEVTRGVIRFLKNRIYPVF